MKKIYLAFLLMCVPFGVKAQELTMATLFKEMPDSLMPYLSRNNRLDMIDFMEANMKAEVTNLLDGRSCMTAMTADSLSIRLSDVLQVEMKLLSAEEQADSNRQAIRVRNKYTINENQTTCIVKIYNVAWKLLQSYVEHSALLNRDEKVFQPRP